MAVVHDACLLLTSATPRTLLVYSKGSNGAAQRTVHSVEGMARTLRLDGRTGHVERSDAPACEVERQLGIRSVVGSITDKQRSRPRHESRRLPSTEREEASLVVAMRGTPVAGQPADAAAGDALTVTRPAVNRREVIVVPASSGGPNASG